MANVKVRAASIFAGGTKLGEMEGTEYDLEGGDEEQFGDPGFLGFSDGSITSKVTATGIVPAPGQKVDLVTPFLNKQDVDISLTTMLGKIHTISMRILKINVKSSHRNGTQRGEFSFGGGVPKVQ